MEGFSITSHRLFADSSDLDLRYVLSEDGEVVTRGMDQEFYLIPGATYNGHLPIWGDGDPRKGNSVSGSGAGQKSRLLMG